MSQDFQQAVSLLARQEDKFLELVEDTKHSITFKAEMLYASTVMMNNDYLAGVAVRNPMSLRSAFQQVAACGLTLNPARGLAYLVPRDGQVILDISYRGMIRMAVEDGAIKDCVVELVYSNDEFCYKGKRKSPEHTFNPFSDKEKRGEFVGVYVEAMLPDGRLHVEAISAEEIMAARGASDLWKKTKKGPWVDFFSSMAKKTAIKIARKYWPQGSGRLDQAISYLNEHGEGFATNNVPAEVVERYMGQADVVVGETVEVETEILPVHTEAAARTEPEPEPEQQKVQDGAEQAQPEPPAPNESSQLPPKVLKKTEQLVARAKSQGCWEAALEYIQGWPMEAMQYAKGQIQAAQYAAISSGE